MFSQSKRQINYKYRWLASGMWRRFPEIIGGNRSSVALDLAVRLRPLFDDERWWCFRCFSASLIWMFFDDASPETINSGGEQPNVRLSKFRFRTTRCCCWWWNVGGGGGGGTEGGGGGTGRATNIQMSLLI